MHLVYLDESGNTGLDLNDAQQPLFLLCAMIIPEEAWQPLESELKASLTKRFPDWKNIEGFEVHAADLRSGRGHFGAISVRDRIAFRDEWMKIGATHDVRLIYRTVTKRAYGSWLSKTFGAGVLINPHTAAFALLAPCVDAYLQSLPGKPRGMFISDENKQVMADVEKSIRVLKDEVGVVRLSQIIEKGFFIDSSKSLLIQLCDLYALHLRKHQERARKLTEPKTIDDSGVELAVALVHEDPKLDKDVIAWLTRQHQTTLSTKK